MALRQAKFYPTRQAAAATDRALRLPQCTSRRNSREGMFCCRNVQDGMFILCIVARALRQQNLKVVLHTALPRGQFAEGLKI